MNEQPAHLTGWFVVLTTETPMSSLQIWIVAEREETIVRDRALKEPNALENSTIQSAKADPSYFTVLTMQIGDVKLLTWPDQAESDSQ
jgi:hypothetical protein